MEIDCWQVNLCMEAVFIRNLFSINWLCESGLVNNIELVVEEYRQTRGLMVGTKADRNMSLCNEYTMTVDHIVCAGCSLQPIRLCVLGPPAVGKSTISKQICQHYKLHHITLKDTILDTIDLLVGSPSKCMIY